MAKLLNPTISTNTYNFDFYEVAYTSLATQLTSVGKFKFPNVTFSDNSIYNTALQTVKVQGSPYNQTINDALTQSITLKDVVVVNNTKAKNIIANNIGIEFYTESWDDTLSMIKELNTTHTWGVDIGGSYTNEEQKQKARISLWNKWWKLLLYMKVNLSDFYLMGLTHTLDVPIATPLDFATFKAYLQSQNVCAEVIQQLEDYYNILPTVTSSDFNDIEEILQTPLNAASVYFLIERIDAHSIEPSGCFSPYKCVKTPTGADYTNMSSGSEEELCVTYWNTATPSTSSTFSNYSELSGACASGGSDIVNVGNYWTKYTSLRRPRFDFINIRGRLITPNEAYVIRKGVEVIKARDLFNACSNTYEYTINYTPFTQSFDAPYGACCVVKNYLEKNWQFDGKITSDYTIGFNPMYADNTSLKVMLSIPSAFYEALRSNPSLLDLEFIFEWQVTLKVEGKCLGEAIVNNYRSIFYPYCGTPLSYKEGCGIIFEDAQGFTNGSTLNAWLALNDMKKDIRTLFESTYNCYALEFSKSNYYGDLIKVNGRLYDEHGSECWFLLKQVLRPDLPESDTVESQELPGFNTSSVVATSTPLEPQLTNDIIPPSQPTLSSLFKKNGNKLCAILPSNLKYK